MGEMAIPADRLYGAQTERARQNFPISDLRFGRRFIEALGAIKLAASRVNRDLGLLDAELGEAIERAAGEAMSGELDSHFVLDIFQTGSGTSTNMNANEVIANRAIQLLGGVVGSRSPVHPNDHVNLGQSSNDVIPTATHVSGLVAIERELLPALERLRAALAEKAEEFDHIAKAGRTHLQDATPVRLGQEFGGYASQLRHGIRRVEAVRPALAELAIGGTAVGTGINTPADFGARMSAALSEILAVAFVPFFFNFARADRTEDSAARDWAYNILQSVEPYGVLFTNGDNDTFPLWYLQEVEGIRRDVTVIVHSYLGTDWYPKQLRSLTTPCEPGVSAADSPTTIVCQRPFDAANAASPYVDAAAPSPARSIIALNDAQIDGLAPGIAIEQDTAFRVSSAVTATVRGGDSILYPDILVFHIMQQSLGDRPVYFAATAPPVYGKWGLQPHLVRHGLAFKLVDAALEETDDLVNLRAYMPNTISPTWNDRARTSELLWDVFRFDGVLEWDEWPEPSTQSSIPAQYYLAYYLHGMTEEHLGDVEAAEEAYGRADHFGLLAGLGVPGN